ncbi:rhodanese-like domain-containing protein [Oscillospiraceae bacterium PP1C4]
MFGLLLRAKFKTMSMAAAKAELEHDPSIKLIDVRTENEYYEGHLPGSINLPLNAAGDIEKIVSDKNAKLFIYCQSGRRSHNACSVFSKLGYTDVTNIGGITAWTGKIAKGIMK